MKFVIKLLILCPFTFDAVPDRYKTQEMCDQAVSNDPFTLTHYLHIYKTQEMCHKAVDDFKPALKFIPNWFLNNDIVEHLDDA